MVADDSNSRHKERYDRQLTAQPSLLCSFHYFKENSVNFSGYRRFSALKNKRKSYIYKRKSQKRYRNEVCAILSDSHLLREESREPLILVYLPRGLLLLPHKITVYICPLAPFFLFPDTYRLLKIILCFV